MAMHSKGKMKKKGYSKGGAKMPMVKKMAG